MNTTAIAEYDYRYIYIYKTLYSIKMRPSLTQYPTGRLVQAMVLSDWIIVMHFWLALKALQMIQNAVARLEFAQAISIHHSSFSFSALASYCS